ncbi:peptidoglycan/LPS O-acetylase OafA/YrhL [Nocardiopsis arvandica]|uniref:Peptidoglycan/LPS O-acetylase OafA/YrhL n=1 Tax=Nocardiopsis sinuspersici TaxID=501010 RepID=A0A7Z0BLG5_9ACTN|nr:peptidoglycan/LPS O-acetylase OafA/YrhL [Nocardiopsis sinuspersici]
MGVLAYRGDWLTRLPGAAGWFGAALAAAGLLALPVVMVVAGGAAPTPGTWQALAQIVVETCFAMGMVLMLLVCFRRFLDRQNRFGRFLSENAFAVYFLHPLVLVGLGLALSGWEAAAIAEFAVMGALAVPACWLLAAAVRAVPGARRIL